MIRAHVAILGIAVLAQVPRLEAQDSTRQYVAKVICGNGREIRGFSIAPQLYSTVVNVFNPGPETVRIEKWIALGYPPGAERPGRTLPVDSLTLRPRQEIAIDCMDLARHIPKAPFFEGVVMVYATGPLHVEALYAVPGGVDVVRVAEEVVVKR